MAAQGPQRDEIRQQEGPWIAMEGITFDMVIAPPRIVLSSVRRCELLAWRPNTDIYSYLAAKQAERVEQAVSVSSTTSMYGIQ